MNIEQQKKLAPLGLVVGCIVFGMGSVIVAHVPVGAYAIAFWRLLVAGVIFVLLSRWLQAAFWVWIYRSGTKVFTQLGQVFLRYSTACKFFGYRLSAGFGLAKNYRACKSSV